MFTLKKSLLILIGLFLFNFIIAGEIVVDYPEEVHVNQEFEFSLKLKNFTQDLYDVKIDISDEEGERISRRFIDGEWKSTFNYFLKAIEGNSEEIFKLRVENYIGEGNILIRVRDQQGNVETFEGYEINIVEEIVENVEKENDPETKDGQETKEKEDNLEKETISEENIFETKKENLSLKQNENEKKELKIINLNPKNIKTREDKSFLSFTDINSQKLTLAGIVIFCCILAFLFGARFYKYKIRENIE